MIHRRFFAGLAASAMMMPAVALAQRAQVRPALGVRIDLAPLRASGMGGPPLTVIERALRRALEPAAVAQGGGFIVRIDSVSLSGFAGGGSADRGRWSGLGSGANDYMAGEVIRTDAAGRVVARFPMHNALAPTGAWYDPAIDLRRLDDLATHFGQWAIRQAG
ncbi:MAG: hypothetical protein ACRCTD_00010 [Beijerinckiaceae bacterium]